MSVLWHQHTRRSVHKKGLQPISHSIWIGALDRLTLFVGVIGPLTTLPQIIQIFSTQDASGVSVLSWTAFASFDLPFIFYGLVHKDKPIATTYICWFVANIAVVLGAIIY